MKKRKLLLIEYFFYKETIKSILFLISIFYLLYVMIDLMAHLKELGDSKISIFTWIEYYLCTFSRRLDILLPFAVLIATIRTLISLQARNELVALLAGGIPLRSALNPMLRTAFACACLLYANYQWVIPYALPRVLYIQQCDFGKDPAEENNHHINEIVLQDMSKVIYQSYDPITKQFKDVFWIASPDDIYHMKTLSSDAKDPVAKFVDRLTRQENGFLEKTESWEITQLKNMQFNKDELQQSITPAQQQSLTQLYKQNALYSSSYSDRASEIRSTFFYRLLFPLLCVLAFVAPAPFCLEFRRRTPIFMIYLLSIASLFCLFLLLQSAFILAKSNMIPAWAAIGAPWVILLYIFGKRYRTL